MRKVMYHQPNISRNDYLQFYNYATIFKTTKVETSSSYFLEVGIIQLLLYLQWKKPDSSVLLFVWVNVRSGNFIARNVISLQDHKHERKREARHRINSITNPLYSTRTGLDLRERGLDRPEPAGKGSGTNGGRRRAALVPWRAHQNNLSIKASYLRRSRHWGSHLRRDTALRAQPRRTQ